jgi:hypothetical protein
MRKEMLQPYRVNILVEKEEWAQLQALLHDKRESISHWLRQKIKDELRTVQ